MEISVQNRIYSKYIEDVIGNGICTFDCAKFLDVSLRRRGSFVSEKQIFETKNI